MRTFKLTFAAVCLTAIAGCGGSGGGPVGTDQAVNTTGFGPTLRAVAGRSYQIFDLGQQSYGWPGWFLSAGRGSLSLNDHGDVVNARSPTALVWTTTSVTMLDGPFGSPTGLNNAGQVTGITSPGNAGYPQRGAIWKAGAVTDIGSLSLSTGTYDRSSSAYAIDDAGQVVGESAITPVDVNTGLRTHAASYANGTLYDLGTLGGYYCRAIALNGAGQAVGYGPTADNTQTHAIFWQNGVHVELSMLTGATYAQASAINETGQVVGFSNRQRVNLFGSPPPRAVLWQGGAITDLGTLGGQGSYATAINNSGVIVGSAETAELRTTEVTTFGYYYDYLTLYGYGWDFNSGSASSGALAPGGGSGYAGGGSGRAAKLRAAGDQQKVNVAHAFVYADGTMLDLNRLLPSGSGWELTQAHAINSTGQIAGLGILQGQVHAFLLSPAGN